MITQIGPFQSEVKFPNGSAFYDRHLLCDRAIDPAVAGPRERYEALAHAVRDMLCPRWVQTRRAYELANPKQVYYLSMEFLIGRSLASNVTNLRLETAIREICKQKNIDWNEIVEQEPDAGLGNGGLGRLAACFVESLATMQIPAMGYGLRYEYGIFQQTLRDGWQFERPDHWLHRSDPWEVARPEHTVEVDLGCSFDIQDGVLRLTWGKPSHLIGVPYDRPVVGYGGKTINTLRLWAARTPNYFDFQQFSSGNFVAALAGTLGAESLTRVLYPDDSTGRGQALRFMQEYFLVACSLADIIRRFRLGGNPWHDLPEKAAVQLNDTHPALAVPELMRILLDDARLGWDEAWDITRRTMAYTNHTLLPEALEKWPLKFFEALLPRHVEIVYEINRRFLDDVRRRFGDDQDRIRRMSLIEENTPRTVRMASLAIIGSHSTNGVAAIHTELLQAKTVADFAQMFPDRFSNKTNGVTPRRWMLLANPPLARTITEAIGDEWITDLSQLERLKPLAEDKSFRTAFRAAKRLAKERLIGWIKTATGETVDPDTLFDSQVKRIHEYKRQFLNALHIVILYNRLRANPNLNVPARTFLFAGKAAPAYRLAKVIIKFINNVAGTVNNDPAVKGRLKVLFLPDYSVSLAERLIPASDVSEQISTAGYEASGTSNMKFMMNGALTIGTQDGATIEMAHAAGKENFFLFGLTAEQVESSRSWYDPWWHYQNEPETRQALDMIFSNYFSRYEPGVFDILRQMLFDRRDFYMHLADLKSYSAAHGKIDQLFADPDAWARKAILNVAASGQFSSDRSIAEYAAEIWNVHPCPVTDESVAEGIAGEFGSK